MPLTLRRQVYKSFPGIFADGVTQHSRKRTEVYRESERNSDIIPGEGLHSQVLQIINLLDRAYVAS